MPVIFPFNAEKSIVIFFANADGMFRQFFRREQAVDCSNLFSRITPHDAKATTVTAWQTF
tara:strand:+ start:521 stop:700 length:180 start_codon:yes stop_codon:yes gene_type:complete